MKVLVVREGGIYRIVTDDAARSEIGYFLSYAGLVTCLSGLPRRAPAVDCEIAHMTLGPNHPLLRPDCPSR